MAGCEDRYVDHRESRDTIEHLRDFALREDLLERNLDAAQAKAGQWREAYTAISKGELVPDRILGFENTERLHGKLVEYAEHAGDKKYSTVKIAPAFYQDRESLELSFTLLKTFKDSKWRAEWEPAHSKALTTQLNLSPPTGVAIYSDDPRNQGTWIMWMLKDVGVDSYVSESTPEGFSGTLICVGYKQSLKLVQP